MAHAGNHHRHIALVGGINHFFIAHRAARLDDGGGAGVGDHVEAVAEREERVTGGYRVLGREYGMPGLDLGNPGGIDAAHLSPTHAQGHAVAAEHDGIGFHVLGDAKSEDEIVHFLIAWFALTYHLQLRHIEIIRSLHQQAAADALHVELVLRDGERNLQQPHILFGAENLARFRAERGPYQHFDKLLAHQGGGGAVDFAIEGDDTA